MPCIYALRLADNLDDRGRELSLLKKAKLRVCTRARVVATLPGDTTEEIVLTHAGEGIVIDTTLVMIGEYRENSSGFLTFWLGVAELVAQLLGRDEAAEIGGVLRCRTPAEMLEVIRVRLGDAADTKLAEARSRFEDVFGGTDDDAEQPIPPPKPSPPPRLRLPRLRRPRMHRRQLIMARAILPHRQGRISPRHSSRSLDPQTSPASGENSS